MDAMDPAPPPAGRSLARIVTTSVAVAALVFVLLRGWPDADPALARVGFDVSEIDEEGLYGPPNDRRARRYEFCVPADSAATAEVRALDRTLELSRAPGSVGCTGTELLAIGSTRQPRWKEVLTSLARLPYVQRIEARYEE